MSEQAPSSSPSRTGVLVGLALLLGVGLYGIVVALSLGLWRQNSPGEGLFPFLIAVAMTAFSALALAAALRERAAPSADAAFDRAKLMRVGAYLVALVFYAAAIDGLGFIVATVITVTFIMRFAERYSWAATLALAVGTAAGCHVLFVLWLGAILPTGALWDRLVN